MQAAAWTFQSHESMVTNGRTVITIQVCWLGTEINR